MASLGNLKELLALRIEQAFPLFPVRVKVSPEDTRTLFVFVFNVPLGEVERIEDFVLDLQDDLDPSLEKLILPMVKTREITKRYYPDVLLELRPSALLGIVSQRIEKFMTDTHFGATAVGCSASAETHWTGSVSYTPEEGALSSSSSFASQGKIAAGRLPGRAKLASMSWKPREPFSTVTTGHNLPLAA